MVKKSQKKSYCKKCYLKDRQGLKNNITYLQISFISARKQRKFNISNHKKTTHWMIYGNLW